MSVELLRRITSVKVRLFSWQGVVATIASAAIGLVSAGAIFKALGGPTA